MTEQPDDSVTLAVITITKAITDDDVMIYVDATCATEEDPPLVEALGMVELAKDTLIRTAMDI